MLSRIASTISTSRPSRLCGAIIHHLPSTISFSPRARESANPPRLGRGDTRGSTGARDHFPTILRSSIAEHPPDKRKTAAQYRAEGPPSRVMSKQSRIAGLIGSSWCKSKPGSHFQRSVSGRSRKLSRKQQHPRWCPGFESLTLRQSSSSSIGVSASIAAFHAAEAGAAPAWSANPSKLPSCKSSAYRPAKAEVRGASPRGSTISMLTML